MTEQTVNETPEVFVVTALPEEEPRRRFVVTRKRIAIATAATAAVGLALYLKVKSSDPELSLEKSEDTNPESETDASV